LVEVAADIMAAAADIMAAAAAVVAGTTEGETVDTDTIMDTMVAMEIMVNLTLHQRLVGNLVVEVPVVEVLAAEEVQEDLLAAVLAVAAVAVLAVAAVAVLAAVAAVAVPVVAVLAAVAEDAVENSTDLDSMTVFTANRIRQSQ
jgi:hypothetical protein